MIRCDGRLAVLYECPHCGNFENVSLSKVMDFREAFEVDKPVITTCSHCDLQLEVTPRNG